MADLISVDPDDLFFRQHRDRKALIRLVRAGEQETEFRSLGPHDQGRRRIIAWKVPSDLPAQFSSWRGRVIRIPYLLFSDESVENSDAILLPLIDTIMREAATSYGLSDKPVVV